MFSHLPTPALDPILSLSGIYRNDSREHKVDLGVGVYKNSAGQTPIMQAISQAQDIVAADRGGEDQTGVGDAHYDASGQRSPEG